MKLLLGFYLIDNKRTVRNHWLVIGYFYANIDTNSDVLGKYITFCLNNFS